MVVLQTDAHRGDSFKAILMFCRPFSSCIFEFTSLNHWELFVEAGRLSVGFFLLKGERPIDKRDGRSLTLVATTVNRAGMFVFCVYVFLRIVSFAMRKIIGFNSGVSENFPSLTSIYVANLFNDSKQSW